VNNALIKASGMTFLGLIELGWIEVISMQLTEEINIEAKYSLKETLKL